MRGVPSFVTPFARRLLSAPTMVGFYSTPLALAAGTATVAAGVLWYLKPTAGWRWRRPRPQAPNLLSSPASPLPPRTPVEKIVAPQQRQEKRGAALSARSTVGPKRSVTSAAPATELECSSSLLSRLEACDADVDDPDTPDTVCVSPGAEPVHTPLVPAEPDTEPECCTHLLALPDELLVLVLASLPATRWHITWKPRAASYRGRKPKKVWQMMIGEALAWAGPCCKAFAESVPKAATVIAGHHGWNVPLAGCPRVRPLSKLEQDTMRLHYYLRAMSTWWLKPQIEFFNLWWTDELSLGFIGPLYIYHQVCRQHTMELGALLIKLGVDACRMPDDVLVPVVSAPGTRCDENSLHLGTQLTTIMTDPSTLLDASWLAARVIPFVETQLRREAIHRRDCMWGHEGWEDSVERALRGSWADSSELRHGKANGC